MNDVQREADPSQPLIPVGPCWRVLASVPRLAVAALLAGVIARFLADELDRGDRFERA